MCLANALRHAAPLAAVLILLAAPAGPVLAQAAAPAENLVEQLARALLMIRHKGEAGPDKCGGRRNDRPGRQETAPARIEPWNVELP